MPSPGGRLGFWSRRPAPSTIEIGCSSFPMYVPTTGNGYDPFLGTAGSSNVTASGGLVQTRFLKYSINGQSSGALTVGCIGQGYSGPGILYDPSGSSSYGTADFVTPGTPWEGYGIVTTNVDLTNRQQFGAANAGSTSYASNTFTHDRALLYAMSNNNFAALAGRVDQGYVVTQIQSYLDEPIIRMSLSYTNTTSIPKVVWCMRGLDPDQDRYPSPGTFATENRRGYLGLDKTQFVYAIGRGEGGKTIGIISPGNGFQPNTAIVSGWPSQCYRADVWASGSNAEGTNDWGICGFTYFGRVDPGQTVMTCMYYVFGLSVDDIYNSASSLA